MKKFVPNLAEFYDLPNPSLRTYFSRVTEGNEVEYRTKFYAGSDVTEIVEKWLTYLRKQLEHKWPTLVKFEEGLASKVGPLSIMKPLSERIPDIKDYYSGTSLPQKHISDDAIKAAIDELWGAGRIRPRSIEQTLSGMKLSTNSGAPFFTKRRLVVQKSVPELMHSMDPYCLPYDDSSSWKAAATLGWRGQEGGPSKSDVKQRVIWMFPFSVNIAEHIVYQPLVASAQRRATIPPWIGRDAVDASISRLMNTKPAGDDIVCTDFTKFDQHFGEAMQTAALRILHGVLASSTLSEWWLSEVYPLKFTMPIICSPETAFSGAHGMASGSGGTNADETMAHRALQHEAAFSHGSTLNPNSMCLGDDGVLTYPGITVKDVIDSYTSHGLVMNEEKQFVAKDECEFLRHWHHKDYVVNGVNVGVYSTCRALGRLAEQERYYDPGKWGKEMVALRQLSIVENCKYHPLREEFADFCMKGDKYRLGLDIPGFLTNLTKWVQKSRDIADDFLGYTKQLGGDGYAGIGNWWIVRYLKSKGSTSSNGAN